MRDAFDPVIIRGSTVHLILTAQHKHLSPKRLNRCLPMALIAACPDLVPAAACVRLTGMARGSCWLEHLHDLHSGYVCLKQSQWGCSEIGILDQGPAGTFHLLWVIPVVEFPVLCKLRSVPQASFQHGDSSSELGTLSWRDRRPGSTSPHQHAQDFRLQLPTSVLKIKNVSGIHYPPKRRSMISEDAGISLPVRLVVRCKMGKRYPTEEETQHQTGKVRDEKGPTVQSGVDRMIFTVIRSVYRPKRPYIVVHGD